MQSPLSVQKVARPRLEGVVTVSPTRRLSFAEFGDPKGRPVIWLHGTPGSRRQIPLDARRYAEQHGIRLIGLDRPGIGASTPHRYARLLDFAADLAVVADALRVDEMAVIGLSGGGPYTLAAAVGLPDRVLAAGVLGGVAPTTGPDAAAGGMMSLAALTAPLLAVADVPVGAMLSQVVRRGRPLATAALQFYAAANPKPDREVLRRPEVKAMVLDDLLNGSRTQAIAPFADIVVLSRDWGFRLGEVAVPVRWWHGDRDHVVPIGHGEHSVALLPDAELIVWRGESHLASFGRGAEVLRGVEQLLDGPGPTLAEPPGA